MKCVIQPFRSIEKPRIVHYRIQQHEHRLANSHPGARASHGKVCALPLSCCKTVGSDVYIEATIMGKSSKLDPETLELIKWCTQVEVFLVAGGATLAQAQEHIEEQVEWFTDQFYDGLTPEEAAKAALSDRE
jgi:hypothetical protein